MARTKGTEKRRLKPEVHPSRRSKDIDADKPPAKKERRFKKSTHAKRRILKEMKHVNSNNSHLPIATVRHCMKEAAPRPITRSAGKLVRQAAEARAGEVLQEALKIMRLMGVRTLTVAHIRSACKWEEEERIRTKARR